MKPLILNHDLNFDDLYSPQGCQKIDALFLDFLKSEDAALHDILLAYRFNTENIESKKLSQFITDTAPYLEKFIFELFKIEVPTHTSLDHFFAIKRNFVQRKSLQFAKKIGIENLDPALITSFLPADFSELAFANQVTQWLKDPAQHEDKLLAAQHYAAWMLLHKKGQGILFKRPEKLNFDALIDIDHIIPQARNGFTLTDHGCDRDYALDQAHYCIYCHHQEKDSCRTGLHEKKSDTLQTNPLGNSLTGCPLDQKISEMNALKAQDFMIGPLAVIMIDNPLCAATGHRICNDCMKSCIFQKQSPVDVPQIETRTLKDVLNLPWGFEIYSLLSRWNPLNLNLPYPKNPTGKSVLIVGQGPSGFNLAHHLLNLGHRILAIDGAKIEPLATDALEPIYNIKSLYESLDDRVMAGFGGVAEYGITVRWDKNFLKIIRLLLERRAQYRLEGGIRFGGTISIEDAFNTYHFHHIALCCGAGKPSLLALQNTLAKGVRQASDFLMALQLTGAAKKSSLSNLQLRLPVLVIGGGLTAIDAATEALAYYPIQVEKFLSRYEASCKKLGLKNVTAQWSEEDHKIADTFIKHAKILRHERTKSSPDILSHLNAWGGVKILYRNALKNAPAYRLNHEEIRHALSQGIEIITDTTPTAFNLDAYDHIESCTTDSRTYPAQTILIATGTKPNTVIAREAPDYFNLEGHFLTPIKNTHPFFVYENKQHQTISYLGDMHPDYSGNVVKAMASAKNGAPHIDKQIQAFDLPQTTLDISSKATLISKKQLTEKWVELIFHAPLQARKYEIGHFYRLQTFSQHAAIIEKTKLTTESIALTPVMHDKSNGTLTFIISNRGASTQLLSTLALNTAVTLMGPTGAICELPHDQNIVLIGEGIGQEILKQYATKARAQNCNVTQLEQYEAYDFSNTDRVYINASAERTHQIIKTLPSTCKAIATINNSMQCMMKEICAQCLHHQIDPKTGESKIVFACFNPYQDARLVDFDCLESRLKQNAVTEKLTHTFLSTLL